MRRYCMMGIDCDPDRCTYPELNWNGVRSIEKILGVIPFALNIRRDFEIASKTGDIDYCFNFPIIQKAKEFGCSVGIHYHSTDKEGKFFHDPQHLNAPNEFKNSIHDGWCYEGLLKEESKLGYKLNYSPMPGGSGAYYHWVNWDNEPKWIDDMLVLPVQTIKTRIARTYNNIATVHPTAPPLLFRRIVKEFEKTNNNTLCCYFHADELFGFIDGIRKYAYSQRNLISNIKFMKKRGFMFENASQVYERFLNERKNKK